MGALSLSSCLKPGKMGQTRYGVRLEKPIEYLGEEDPLFLIPAASAWTLLTPEAGMLCKHAVSHPQDVQCRKVFAREDDSLITPVAAQVVSDIHPANDAVRGANHQHDRVLLFLPIVYQPVIFHRKDFRAVFALVEIGITGLQLQVEPFAAGVALHILELDLAIDAPIGITIRACPLLFSL